MEWTVQNIQDIEQKQLLTIQSDKNIPNKDIYNQQGEKVHSR